MDAGWLAVYRELMGASRRRFLAASLGAIAGPSFAGARGLVSDSAIGQMLVLGFSGDAADAPGARRLAAHVAAGHVGGVCFLGHNAHSRAGVEGLARLFGTAGARNRTLIAIDHEGGAVQRLGPKLGYPYIPAARDVAANVGPDRAQSLYRAVAQEMRKAGFNLNLAPVVDLGFEPRNPAVTYWGRTFGKDGATVAQYAAAFIAGHRQAGVLTTVKHFPGHGSTLVDSHDQIVDLTPTWREDELTPYRILARAGMIDVVMSGHLAHADLTGGEPATLSRKAVETVLRESIGYQGVVMTDDLDMAAIRTKYSLKDAVIKAVTAGNDLILLSNSLDPDPDLPITVIGWIRAAIAAGQIPAGRIEQSAARLAALRASPAFHPAGSAPG
jgi:beta-N-acetylhexosaminidase